MRELIKYNLGFAELEHFNLGLMSKVKSEKMREDGEKMTRKILRLAMEFKIEDEIRLHDELDKDRMRMRRELRDKLGENSRPYRNTIRHLREMALRTKQEQREKYRKKLAHLRKKFNGTPEIEQIPDQRL